MRFASIDRVPPAFDVAIRDLIFPISVSVLIARDNRWEISRDPVTIERGN